MWAVVFVQRGPPALALVPDLPAMKPDPPIRNTGQLLSTPVIGTKWRCGIPVSKILVMLKWEVVIYVTRQPTE